MKIAILTSKKSWFIPYAEKFVQYLQQGYDIKLYHNHEDIEPSNVVFILSYFRIIPETYLKRHTKNLVVHESNLPHGKGWSPLFWQIIEGRNSIPIVLFEATAECDSGDIYLKGHINCKGTELNKELRHMQAMKTLELCKKFLENPKVQGTAQTGQNTEYPKRGPKDSELNIDKSLREQFNLLRTVDNEDYPAFFRYKGKKFVIKIYEDPKKDT